MFSKPGTRIKIGLAIGNLLILLEGDKHFLDNLYTQWASNVFYPRGDFFMIILMIVNVREANILLSKARKPLQGLEFVLLLLLLLHLLDHSRCNCEKLRFHNNGIVMMNLLVTAALGSGCTQPSLLWITFNFHNS